MPKRGDQNGLVQRHPDLAAFREGVKKLASTSAGVETATDKRKSLSESRSRSVEQPSEANTNRLAHAQARVHHFVFQNPAAPSPGGGASGLSL